MVYGNKQLVLVGITPQTYCAHSRWRKTIHETPFWMDEPDFA